MNNSLVAVVIQICNILLPGDKDFEHKILQAYEKPQQYIAENSSKLADRGVLAPTPNLLSIAIVDELEARKRGGEVDWKVDTETLIWTIQNILPKHSSSLEFKWVNAEEWDERADTETSLRELGEYFKKHQFSLVSFDIDSDSYTLAIVEASKASLLKELMGKLNREIEIWQ